ncbi:hypothetical protein SXCC_01246 [Gluconacetobacter sp. SXCC-1]|nr:hypothetical protein SXCC_01246 [Gluconacetobacter sp. SXCC-1]
MDTLLFSGLSGPEASGQTLSFLSSGAWGGLSFHIRPYSRLLLSM